MKNMVLVIIVCCCIQPLYSELPTKPSIEDVVNSSDLIVTAEPINIIDVDASIGIRYRVITFRIHDIYKGIPITDPLVVNKTNSKTILGPLLNVIILKLGTIECRRTPNYEMKKHYILFLGDEILESLYVRSEIDAIWEETLWTEQKEKKVKSALLSSDKRFDNYLDYVIPENAKQKEIASESEQTEISKKIEYLQVIDTPNSFTVQFHFRSLTLSGANSLCRL